MSRENVLERIRKLLALADEQSGGTQGERENAAERAHVLMLKHQVEERELADAAGRQNLPGIEVAPAVAILGRDERWREQLYMAIAHHVTVDVLRIVSGRGDDAMRVISLVGRPESMEYVRTMADWIGPQLITACEAAVIEHEHKSTTVDMFGETISINRVLLDLGMSQWLAQPQKVGPKFRETFFLAAIERLDRRLTTAQDLAEVDSTALVRSDRAAIDDFYGDVRPDVLPPDEIEVDEAAARRGYEAGGRLDLAPTQKLADSEPTQLPSRSDS